MSSYTEFIIKLSASLRTVITRMLCAGSRNSISFLEYDPPSFELHRTNSFVLTQSVMVFNDMN